MRVGGGEGVPKWRLQEREVLQQYAQRSYVVLCVSLFYSIGFVWNLRAMIGRGGVPKWRFPTTCVSEFFYR